MTTTDLLRPVLLALAHALAWSGQVHAQAGQLDPTFGEDGRVFFDPIEGIIINDIALQPDGRIILVGRVEAEDENDRFITLRLLPDGAPDASFGDGGQAIADVGYGCEAMRVAVLSDGRIAVLGNAGGIDVATNAAVVVYDSGGSLDTGFNGTGSILFSTDPHFESVDILARPDGGLLIVGRSEQLLRLRMLDAQGAPIDAFSFDGTVATQVPAMTADPMHVLPGPDGGIHVCGTAWTEGGGYGVSVLHYHANGSLDAGFGENGQAMVPFGEGGFLLAGADLGADGRVMLVVPGLFPGPAPDRLVRLLSDGSLDASFGPGGILVAPQLPTTLPLTAVVHPDGRILLGGTGLGDAWLPSITRCTPAFEPDPSFGEGGHALVPTTPYTDFGEPYFNAIVVQSDGSPIAVANIVMESHERIAMVVRLHNDGWTSIASSGSASPGFTLYYDPVGDVVRATLDDALGGEQSLELVDVAGRCVQRTRIVALPADGSATCELPLHGLANGTYVVSDTGPLGRRSAPFLISHH